MENPQSPVGKPSNQQNFLQEYNRVLIFAPLISYSDGEF